jgi:hypothetical protein
MLLSFANLSDDVFQDFAFEIQGAPKAVPLAVDLHEPLVQMSPPGE